MDVKAKIFEEKVHERVNQCMNDENENVLEEVTGIKKIIAEDVLVRSKGREVDKNIQLLNNKAQKVNAIKKKFKK